MSAIKGGALQRKSEFCRLNYGVLLGVDGVAHLLSGAGGNAHYFAYALRSFLTGRNALRGAVITGSQNALVSYDNGADLAVWFEAAAPAGDQLCHIHES